MGDHGDREFDNWLTKRDADIRKPYADKIMQLEARIAVLEAELETYRQYADDDPTCSYGSDHSI